MSAIFIDGDETVVFGNGEQGPSGPPGTPGTPGTVTYAVPAVGPATIQLAAARWLRQGLNTSRGQLLVTTNAAAIVGDTITLYDTGGALSQYSANLSDPNGCPIQDPGGQGLVLVPSYPMQQPGGAWTWTLTFDATSNTTYWAVTG